MKYPFRRFMIAAAMGAMSVAAYAQYPSASPTTSAGPATASSAKAEGDYRAAQAACEKELGTAKQVCLHNAKAAYEQALVNGDAALAAPQSGGSIAGGSGLHSPTHPVSR